MNPESRTSQVIHLALCGLAGLCSLAGCAEHNYKKEADQQVHRIIDQKWSDDFGSKANYTISDVTPLPNDIQIEKGAPSPES